MSPPSQQLSVKDLNRSISAGRIESVYLFHGDEEFNKESKLNQLIDLVLGPGDRDFNLDSRYASDLSAEDLDGLLNTPPLLSNRRVVVIGDISSLKKGARTILDRYLAVPSADLLLILVENGELPKSEKSLLSSCCVVDFPRLLHADLQKWVDQHAATVLGVRITPEATRLLIEVVGNDMGQLALELDKLKSYSGSDDVITVEAVEHLVGVRHGETVANLLDAIALRDVDRALSLVSHVLAQSRSSAVSVILALTTQTLALAYARAVIDEGQSASRVGKVFYDFLAAGKGMTARPWKEAVAVWERAVGKWTSAELAAACEVLLRADMSLKETRSSSEEQMLSSLILELSPHVQSA